MMSKKFAKMSKDKRAEMGVGTMIIFIAMVLVAAVAASVLISTANTVREQATQTGNDAINNVASGFDLKYVKGTVDTNAIDNLYIYVQLAAGSPSINMNDVTLSITAGAISGELEYAAAAADDMYIAELVHQGVAGSTAFTDHQTVVQGDLVKITVASLATTALDIAPGASVSIKVMPSTGSPLTISFTIPSVLVEGSTVNLR